MAKKSAKLIVIAAISLVLFAFTFAVVFLGILTETENIIGEAVRSLRNDILTPVLTVITNIGDWMVIAMFCLIVLALPKTRLKLGIPLAVGLLGSAGVNQVLKRIVARARPDVIYHLVEEDGFSFPSGHSMNNTVLYVMLIIAIWLFLKRTNIKVLLTLFCAAMLGTIIFSRIYLGVHYLGDVIAGFFLGICIACAVYAIWLLMFEGINEKRHRKIEAKNRSIIDRDE